MSLKQIREERVERGQREGQKGDGAMVRKKKRAVIKAMREIHDRCDDDVFFDERFGRDHFMGGGGPQARSSISIISSSTMVLLPRPLGYFGTPALSSDVPGSSTLTSVLHSDSKLSLPSYRGEGDVVDRRDFLGWNALANVWDRNEGIVVKVAKLCGVVRKARIVG